MNTFLSNKKSTFLGMFVSGSTFILFDSLWSADNSSFSLFILVSLATGFVLGDLMRVANKKFNWLTGGIMLSLVYIPIFLSVIGHNPEDSWGLVEFIIAFPGITFLSILGGEKYFGQYPEPSYFILMGTAGLITLTILSLIISPVGLLWKRLRDRLRHQLY